MREHFKKHLKNFKKNQKVLREERDKRTHSVGNLEIEAPVRTYLYSCELKSRPPLI